MEQESLTEMKGDNHAEFMLQRRKDIDIEPSQAFPERLVLRHENDLRNPIDFLLVIMVRKEVGEWKQILAMETFGRNIPRCRFSEISWQ